MKKNKVYTKTGDDGNTSLISGKRVPKHDCRIKAYGSIDELNSWVGIIRSFDISKDINNELILIQRNLMTIASQLSNDSNNFLNLDIIKISNEDVLLLEQSIDNMTEELPDLKNFVIPGGHETIANTHLARCVCRRAERCITKLSSTSEVDSVILFYINRLSDYLFTLSRKFSFDLKIEEIKWIPNINT